MDDLGTISEYYTPVPLLFGLIKGENTFKGVSVMDGMAHNMAAANFKGFPQCAYQLSNANSGNKIEVSLQIF